MFPGGRELTGVAPRGRRGRRWEVPMRPVSMLAMAVLLVCASPPRVSAQETPDSVTPAEQRCQRALGGALADLGDATGEALAECQTSPGRQGALFFPDPITAYCLSRANAAAKRRVLSKCSGSDCPDCYAGGENCEFYAEGLFSTTASSVELAIDALYCDDAFSADGLTRAEQKCQSKLVDASARFVNTLQRCFAKCQQAVQKGSTTSSCGGAFLDTPAFDPRTQRCIDRARARLLDGCEDHCADPPDCFPFSCSEAAQLVEEQALTAEPAVYCQDIPQVCGDGLVTGDESCDTAAPNSCPPGTSCFGCFACFLNCGNGVVDPGEICDRFASPSGCADGLACSSTCDACVEPRAGFCVPTSPDTCNAGLHDCFQPCDNGFPGSACVSTVESSAGGSFVCVEEVCTFRTCDTSAECFPGEVCFTEGCCGTPIPGTVAGGALGGLLSKVW